MTREQSVKGNQVAVGISILLVGMVFGSVFERRGIMPSFISEDTVAINAFVKSSRQLEEPFLSLIDSEYGVRIGSGATEITVFTNLECYYCAVLDSTISKIVQDSDDYSFIIRHVTNQTQGTLYKKHRMVQCSFALGLPVGAVLTKAYSLPRDDPWSVEAVLSELQLGEFSDQVNDCVTNFGEAAKSVSLTLEIDSTVVSKIPVLATPSWVIGSHFGTGAIPPSIFEEVVRQLSE